MHILNVLMFLAILSLGTTDGAVQDRVEASSLRLASGDMSFNRKEFEGVDSEAVVVAIGQGEPCSLEMELMKAKEDFISGNTSAFSSDVFINDERVPAMLARQAKGVENSEMRFRLLSQAVDMERKRVELSEGLFSRNVDLRNELVDLAYQDSVGRVRRLCTNWLLENVAPEELNSNRNAIRCAAEKWKDIGTLQLYGVVTASSAEALSILSEIRIDPESENSRLKVLAIKSRFGDEASQASLREKATIPSGKGTQYVGNVAEALAYVDTSDMKRFLANGLRSESLIELAGGATMPERDLYADALVTMMRFEEGFPIRGKSGFHFSDDELDLVEDWCKSNLGTAFPEQARKALQARPSLSY